MNKIVAGLLIAALVLLGAAGAAYLFFVRGVLGFDTWLVRKVADLAEVYLVPDIHFDDFEYDGAATVTMMGVSLTAPDGTEVVAASSLTVVLAERPSFGGGITIERVTITDGRLNLIRDEGETGGFRGLIPFVEGQKIADQERVEEDQKLGNALKIRRISMENAGLVYDPGGGAPPMRLEGVTMDLDVTPVRDAGPRVYALDIDIDRAPVAEIAVAGTIDLDTLVARIKNARIGADLNTDEGMAALPPQVQSIIRRYDAHGALTVAATGTANLGDPLGSTIRANASLEQFNLAAGEFRLPIDHAELIASLEGRVVTLPGLDVATAGGTVSASDVRLDLNNEQSLPASLSWRVQGVELQQLLVATQAEGDAPPMMAGAVASQGSATLNAGEIPASVSGAGTVNITEGRLVEIPVISGLVRAMDLVGKLRKKPLFKDTLEAEFNLTGEHIDLTRFAAATSVVAARGKGTIGYDRALDLTVNAGPLEKLQEDTGVIGDIFGALTDSLVKYHVGGAIGDVKISVRPLGLGG